MKLVFTIVYIVVALLLTVIVLFQKGKDARSSAVMGNTGETFFSKNKSNTLDGILEKLAANPGKRILPFAITRCWDDEKGWVFSIK